jgi:hypothetical protein
MARSSLHIVRMRHRHHVGIQTGHDPKRSDKDECHYQNAEGKGEYVVGVVRRAAYVKKEDEMDSHLCDGEDGKKHGNTGRPHQIVPATPKDASVSGLPLLGDPS